MSEYLSSLGRMLIFSTLLPGALGTALMMLLFPKMHTTDFTTYQTVMLVYGLGFAANCAGHFTETVISWIWKKWPKTPYTDLLPILPDIDPALAQIVTHDFDYLECLHCWYWNSATLLIGFAAVKIVSVLPFPLTALSTLDIFTLCGCATAAPVLYFLSYQQQKWNSYRARSLRNHLSRKARSVLVDRANPVPDLQMQKSQRPAPGNSETRGGVSNLP